MTEIPVFPINAWIQIAVVLAFIIFVVIVFRYVFNHFKDISEAQEKIVSTFLKATELRDQKFVESLDKRDMMFEGRNALTIAEIKTVQSKLEILNNTLIDHDAKTNQALADMQIAKSKRKTVPAKEPAGNHA